MPRNDRITAIYIRVSSRSQDHRSQRPDLERWVAAHEGATAWYQDTASGATLARPGWQRLWGDVLAGRLLGTILAAMAEYELEVLSQRQREGIAAAKAAGVVFGRPKGTGRPVKVTPDVRELVQRLHAEGKAVAAIARLTHLSRQTVYTVLHQRKTNGTAPE